MCGAMPTHIEHIIPYSVVKEHKFENLVLLCTHHHQEVTSGRINKEEVARARNKPYSTEQRAYYLPLLSEQCHVDFGTVRFIVNRNNKLRPFSIKSKCPIEIELGEKPKFSLALSGRSGEDAVRVTDNNFEFMPRNLWDVRLSGQQLLVKYGLNKVLLKAKIKNGNLHFSSIRMVVENLPVIADQNGIHFPNTKTTFGRVSIDARKQIDSFISSERCHNSAFIIPYSPSSSPEAAWEIAQNYRSKKLD